MITIRLTLPEVCGPGYAFHPRRPAAASRWASTGIVSDEASTGGQACIVGEMPLICSKGAVKSDALTLLHVFGLNIDCPFYTYSNESERLSQIKKVCDLGLKIVASHWLPPEELVERDSWIKPSLLSALNNKRELTRFVPREAAPQRELVPLSNLLDTRMISRLPLVAKAATDETSGAGVGVHICKTGEDLKSAHAMLKGCTQIILETYLNFTQNLCLNFAIFHDGKIEYLGAAEQIMSQGSNYAGNWLGSTIVAPEKAVAAATRVMEAGRDAGYFGIAGLDLGVLEDDSVVIYDLNFRFNGSTVPLLLFESTSNRTNASMAKFTSLQASTDFRKFLRLLDRVSPAGYLLPFSVFDPNHVGITHAKQIAKVLVFGDSKAHVEERLTELRAMGFE